MIYLRLLNGMIKKQARLPISSYPELVETVKLDYRRRIQKNDASNSTIKYQDCDVWYAGDQINLWSYWQGYQISNSLGKEPIDILLVGQDWGTPTDSHKGIQKIKNGLMAYNETSTTDRNLKELFEVLGIHIDSLNPGKRIFFTNYSLGYRSGSETGGMTKSLMAQDTPAFKALVRILKPKYIICLGRIVYEMVTGTTTKAYLSELKEGRCLMFDLGGIRVFCVPHPGARGLNNLGQGNMNANKELMKQIWSDMYQKMV